MMITKHTSAFSRQRYWRLSAIAVIATAYATAYLISTRFMIPAANLRYATFSESEVADACIYWAFFPVHRLHRALRLPGFQTHLCEARYGTPDGGYMYAPPNSLFPIWILATPDWCVVAAILVVVLVFVVCDARSRGSMCKHGLCPTCGYDLRASKDKCPECGSPIVPPPIEPDPRNSA
jgi:hypothetical protein